MRDTTYLRRIGLVGGGVLLSLLALWGTGMAGPPGSATHLPLVAGGMAAPTPTTAPTPGGNYNIAVGPGYTDVSPKQLVRTSTNRLYISASTCESYPCTDIAQTLRMYRANANGVPASFTRADSAHEPGGVAGWAIAIDGANTIHVAWTERLSSGSSLGRLRYTTFSTATDTWGATTETVDAALNITLGSGGQGVQTVALALDASGVPHLVYLKSSAAGPGRRVYYRSRAGGQWGAAAQLDDTTTYGSNQQAWHPNLAFDTAGRLLAVWQRGSFNGDNDGTIIGRVRATGGSWGGPVNISGTNAARVIIDQSTSLLITPDNRYHIVWIAAGNDAIRYQYSTDNGQAWSFNNPGGGSQATHNPALGYAAGKVRIYGHGTPDPIPDGHGDDLYYFEGAGGAAVWGTWTQFVTGAYDSSVNVRWSQFFHAFPNTIDLAYWNDQYPNQLYAGVYEAAPGPQSPRPKR